MACKISVNTMLVSAVVLTVFSVGALISALATTNWVKIDVNREELKKIGDSTLESNLQKMVIYFDRVRGLFKTCYSTSENRTTLDFTDGEYCENETGYSFTKPQEGVSDNDYDVRNHLLRCTMAFFLFAVLFMGISLIIGLLGFCQESFTMIKWAGILEITAAISNAFAMAFFHGVYYLETQKIRILDFPATWKTQHSDLNQHSTINLGYSYALGWVSVALSIVASILYFQGISAKREEEKKSAPNRGSIYKNFYLNSKLDSSLKGRARMSSGRTNVDEDYYNNTFMRNRAYDMLDKPSRFYAGRF